MGICASGLSEEEAACLAQSDAMDRELALEYQQQQQVIKLLLLGTGESGKSTLFKQMQILYEDGFTDYEKTTYKHVLRRNIVEAVQTLVAGVAKFTNQGVSPFTEPQQQAAAAFIEAIDYTSVDFWRDEIVTHAKTLWNDTPQIKDVYALRSQLQLLDSTEYLLSNIDRLGAADFEPNKDDILRSRVRTSGISERTIRINDVDFQFLDVGGQRNERRKWIHSFDCVTAIFFIVAISEYDQVLFEDDQANRLQESLRVFDGICNNPCFASTSIILFLNKKDLFAEKIKNVQLSSCFPEYDGDNSYADAADFIKDEFLAVNQGGKKIYSHLTCATDTDNVEKVFENCREIILKKNLEVLGL